MGLYYKTLRIRNLWEMNRFRSKLVTFGLDKYTNLNKQAHLLTMESVDYKSVLFYGTGRRELEQTSTLAYYEVRRLRIRNVSMVQAIDS